MTKDDINSFAYSISKQQIGLVPSIPENWARQRMCFYNVYEKIEMAGGRIQFGWIFNLRRSAKVLWNPGYIVAIHHAVWHELSTGRLFDITPFHDDMLHHPLTENNNVVFLLDDNAKPVVANSAHIPLPSKFHTLDESKEMAEYIDSLIQQENETHKRFLNLDLREGDLWVYGGKIPAI